MTQTWQGVAAEDVDEIDTATGLRLAARSRRLLGSLLRPHLRAASAALGLLVIDQIALLAGPLLIAAAIDRGIPAALDGRPGPLAWCVAGYALAGAADALIVGAFLRLSGRIGQDVLVDLRQRVFAQTQRLSLSPASGNWCLLPERCLLIQRYWYSMKPPPRWTSHPSAPCRPRWPPCSPAAPR